MLHPTKNRLNILNSFPSFDSENGSFPQEKSKKNLENILYQKNCLRSQKIVLWFVSSRFCLFSSHFRTIFAFTKL